nr:DUF5812 family protein [Candidatus Halobonum tyrrellensis]
MDALEAALSGASLDVEADDGGERSEGVFLVTHADEGSAVVRNVDSGQVHTLSTNPGVEEGDAVEGVVAPDPPMNVSWQLVEIDDRRSVPIERSSESPTRQSLDIAADQPTGELARRERAGEGEIHVLTVPEADTERAVEDVVSDDVTRARALRMGVDRVEVRSAPGVVVVRYMP